MLNLNAFFDWFEKYKNRNIEYVDLSKPIIDNAFLNISSLIDNKYRVKVYFHAGYYFAFDIDKNISKAEFIDKFESAYHNKLLELQETIDNLKSFKINYSKYIVTLHIKEYNADCNRGVEIDIPSEKEFNTLEEVRDEIVFQIQQKIREKAHYKYQVQKLDTLKYRFIKDDDFYEIYTWNVKEVKN